MKLQPPESPVCVVKPVQSQHLAPKRRGVFTDLGLMDYDNALELQKKTRDKIIESPGEPDHIYFVQHPRVYTLGKNGGKENIMVSQSFLTSENIRVVHTKRGGNITYHCPGQAVLYPVVNLEKAKITVEDFVSGLEEIMKLTARDFGVQTAGNPKNRGLWVGEHKIGSVGLALRKGVSIHGLALNVDPDLTPFSWINPILGAECTRDCRFCNVKSNQVLGNIGRSTGSISRFCWRSLSHMTVRLIFEKAFRIFSAEGLALTFSYSAYYTRFFLISPD